MQAVKSKGSQIETKLAKALFSKGFRYRKNDHLVLGKPDLTLKKYKLAIFVDGEFWHGKDWEKRKKDHKSNQDFWIAKIERNIQRDKEVNERLSKEGWLVLRFWGREVSKDLVGCINKIQKALNENETKNIH